MTFAPHPAILARRKAAANRAAATRRRRRDARLSHVARLIAEGKSAGPSPRCLICRRTLKDETAVNRGVGIECWADVQAAIEERGGA
jgi:hypothetical protein